MNKWMEEIIKELEENHVDFSVKYLRGFGSDFELIIAEFNAQIAKEIIKKHTPARRSAKLTLE